MEKIISIRVTHELIKKLRQIVGPCGVPGKFIKNLILWFFKLKPETQKKILISFEKEE